MKEKIVALFLACFIAMGLSACDAGPKKPANDNDIVGDEHSNTQPSAPNSNTSNSANNGTGNSTDSNSNTTAGDTVPETKSRSYNNNYNGKSTYGGGVGDYSTTNPALGVQQTATWRQMLQNGRVHDRDGFLLDGENSHWE